MRERMAHHNGFVGIHVGNDRLEGFTPDRVGAPVLLAQAPGRFACSSVSLAQNEDPLRQIDLQIDRDPPISIILPID